MEEVIKISAFSIVTVLLALQFKGVKPEYSTYIGAALGMIIFAYVVMQVMTVMNRLNVIQRYLGDGQEYIGVLVKVLGISYICEFGEGICKDAGYGAAAQQIELLGKLSIMFAGLPILFAVIEQIQFFMQ